MGQTTLWRSADATDEGRLADLREHLLGLIGIDAAEYAPLRSRRWSTFRCVEERRAEVAAQRGNAAPSTGGNDGLGSGGARGRSRRFSPSRTCTGPIRPRSISWPGSSSVARRPLCWSSPPRGRNSERPGRCAHTTASFHSRRSTAPRCAGWSARSHEAGMRSPTRRSMEWASERAASRYSSRR